MADQSQKKDAGKACFDLIPWNEFTSASYEYSLAEVDQALKTWWSGRPFKWDASIPQRQLLGVAKVLAFGAAKYAPRGWESGIQYSRIFAAACRHASAYLAGDLVDEETGLPHESHFWCNILFLAVFARRGRTDLDDRPEPVAEVREQLAQIEGLLADFAEPAPPSSGAN